RQEGWSVKFSAKRPNGQDLSTTRPVMVPVGFSVTSTGPLSLPSTIAVAPSCPSRVHRKSRRTSPSARAATAPRTLAASATAPRPRRGYRESERRPLVVLRVEKRGGRLRGEQA